ncbi:addiction module RelE/StbE family toxin [Anaerobacterium chartisolvens]|uniref:Addiction module RelE/StbE family toxin n=1 Tax=Anaerobacterium chartisolvens TaxID=1297424 RepID=A0A369BHP6_9FIRM|nr:type II toxin-antitoxin system RelE/ParE family toxin [Anaerobacterium chartisolvens]RCX21092.1 addiction module RelE/StbE family toxin [Anaerobacterium chartisolvens]
MTKLYLSPEAKNDLHEIKTYITEELLNETAALNVVTNITASIRKLSDFPGMGASLSSIVDIETQYRFLVCGHYTAFYHIEGNSVYVDRVLYGRRDFMKVLFGESAGDRQGSS